MSTSRCRARYRLFFERLWREVRYATIGIAVNQAIHHINLSAKHLAYEAERAPATTFTSAESERWASAIQKWTSNGWSVNTVREQIQRHLDIVDFHLPLPVKDRLARKLKLLVFEDDVEVESKPLGPKQRRAIWKEVQELIKPGTFAMFSASIPAAMAAVFEEHRTEEAVAEEEAKRLVSCLMRAHFRKNKKWKEAFSEDKMPVVGGITEAIEMGFRRIIEVLALPE